MLVLKYFLLGVTVHFIEKWVPISLLVDFIELKDEHTGSEIAKHFISVLENYDIENRVTF